MRNVMKIIKLMRGTLEKLDDKAIKVECEGYMPLCIECLGVGPRGHVLVSVAHYHEQNGDLMRDPDMEFELQGEVWHPVSYRQDNMGIMQEAVLLDEQNKVLLRPRMIKDLKTFARQWDRNIGEQGFVEAAKLAAKSEV